MHFLTDSYVDKASPDPNDSEGSDIDLDIE